MKMFKFEETGIKGLMVIYPKIFEDERGQLKKTFERRIFKEHGIDLDTWEEIETTSHLGVLRGLHLQYQNSQAKLIRVVRGKIYDVVVDLRDHSPTFGQHFGIELSDKNKKMLYIPEGFAHGCLVLEENTTFYYLCSSPYQPEYDGGINYADPFLNIKWPSIEKMIVSNKDQSLPTFKQYQELINQKKDT